MKNTYNIRTITRNDLDIAVEWAAKEGWNPGLYDADCFYKIDKSGFFMGVLGDDPISCISAVSWSKDFGFLGFYIVKPEYRGKGYGIQIWNAAMKYFGDRNIGLDGVVEQQENYKKSGFKFAYNNARYQFISKKFTNNESGIVRIKAMSFNDLVNYDRQFFPADRTDFLNCWLKQPESTTLVSIKNNQIQGYGIIRKCRTGYKIGPLFTETFDGADNLFKSLVSSIPVGVPVFLDIPEVNPEAVTLVTKYSMVKSFSTARMYNKFTPVLPIKRIYGVTTYEVG